jgi:hypothetical protein
MSADLSQPTAPTNSTRGVFYARLAWIAASAILAALLIWRVIAVNVESNAQFHRLLKSAVPLSRQVENALSAGQTEELHALLSRRLQAEWPPEALARLLAAHPELARPKTTLGFSSQGSFGVSLPALVGLRSEDSESRYIFRYRVLDADHKPAGELHIWIMLDGDQPRIKRLVLKDEILLGR